MATTTNYNFPTPDDTSLVKDGASAIRTLGSAVDTSMFAALSAKPAQGVLLNTTTLSGTATQIQSVFSSSYDAYVIQVQINSFTGTSSGISLQLVSGSTPNNTAANYQSALLEQAYANGTVVTSFNNGSTANWSIGRVDGSRQGASFQATIANPFASQFTTYQTNYSDGGYHGRAGGILNVTTSYDGIRLFFGSGGSFTGTARIYGLRNS